MKRSIALVTVVAQSGYKLCSARWRAQTDPLDYCGPHSIQWLLGAATT